MCSSPNECIQRCLWFMLVIMYSGFQRVKTIILPGISHVLYHLSPDYNIHTIWCLYSTFGVGHYRFLQRIIWNSYFHPIWQNFCNILYVICSWFLIILLNSINKNDVLPIYTCHYFSLYTRNQAWGGFNSYKYVWL